MTLQPRLALKIVGPKIALIALIATALGHLGIQFSRESHVVHEQTRLAHNTNRLLARLDQLLDERATHMLSLVNETDPTRMAAIRRSSAEILRHQEKLALLPHSPRGRKLIERMISRERKVVATHERLIQEDLSAGPVWEITREYVVWRHHYEALRAIFNDVKIFNIKRLERLIAEADERRLEALRGIFLLLGAALLLVLGMSFYTSHQVVRPVLRMTEAARQISRDHLDGRIEIGRRTDELGELAVAINSMTDHLIEANRKLREALESRDQFLSVASHELKTPLTSLKIQIQVTRKFLEKGAVVPGEKLERVFSIADRQIDRLTFLIEDLLDVSRIRAGKLELRREPTDLVSLVSEVVERCGEEAAGNGARLRLSAPEPIQGHWDGSRLEQVLVNLLNNALKYAPDGPIEIEVRRESSASGEAAVVLVRDYGPGIDAASEQRIFLPFERSSADRGISGLGLGLYIAREIVELHRGEIRLLRQPGAGAVFEVRLPMGASEATGQEFRPGLRMALAHRDSTTSAV